MKPTGSKLEFKKFARNDGSRALSGDFEVGLQPGSADKLLACRSL
jgi:hypothetical protein